MKEILDCHTETDGDHSMNSPVVVIPDADAELSLKVMRCLGIDRGYNAYLVTSEVANPATRSRYCVGTEMRQGISDAAHLERLLQLGGDRQGGILLPVTLSGFQFVATNREALANAFSLPPLPPRETIDLASDKWRLFTLAREHQLPLLPSEALTRQVIDAIRSGTSGLRLPVLVKSRQRRGGAGFQKLVSLAQLESFGSRITDRDKDEYLVQPFIHGMDYSLSVFCERGVIKAYTLWRALAYGGRQFTIPRVIQFVEHDGIFSAGQKLMAILEWEGVCDIDFFMDEETGQFWLLEVNARFWQTVSAAAAAGVNFPVLCCEAAAAARAAYWPSQKKGLRYSRPSGVPALFTMRDTRLRGSLEILRNTGLWEILRDPLPEIATLLNRAARRRIPSD